MNITYFQVMGTPLRLCDQLLWQQTTSLPVT